MRRRFFSARGIRHSALLSLLLLAGCDVFGSVAYKVVGPPKVAAVYTPAQEPMLVLVENFQHPSDAYADVEMLARTLYAEIERLKIAPLVPMEKLYELRTTRAGDYQKMSIAAIGRELGAKQVLYVDLQQASVEAPTGGDRIRGRAAVSVRVVDATTGSSRWPEDSAEGYPVAYETPVPRVEDATSVGAVRAATHRGLATRVCRLFYKWQADSLEPGTAG